MSILDIESFQRLNRNNRRSEACEDDAEMTAPYIGLCPEESGNEKGLNFGMQSMRSETKRTFARWCLENA